MDEEKVILKKKSNKDLDDNTNKQNQNYNIIDNSNSVNNDDDFIEIPTKIESNYYSDINNDINNSNIDNNISDDNISDDNNNNTNIINKNDNIENNNHNNINHSHNNNAHSHNNEKKKKKKHNNHHGHSHGDNHDSDNSSHNDESDEESPLKNKLKNMESKKKARYSLILALSLTTIFMVGEIIGGWLANSLAIMTDAAHLLTDIGAMFLSLFAMWISQHPPTSSMSFGFHRAEILGAVISVLMIWALTGVLVYEAVQRIINPPEVIDGKVMFIIASCGLLINIIDAIILHWGSGGHGHSHGGGHGHSHGGGHSHSQKKKKEKIKDEIEIEIESDQKKGKSVKNINVHSAYIHVLGDCFQSIGVMIASVIIWVRPTWKIADPITTLIFSVIVLGTTIRLLRESLGVLMEGVPPEIDVAEVKGDLSDIEGVTEVHDLHIWSITLGRPALSVHLTISPETDQETILAIANKILLDDFDITHTTIQIEKPVDKSNCLEHSCPPFDQKKKKKIKNQAILNNIQ